VFWVFTLTLCNYRTHPEESSEDPTSSLVATLLLYFIGAIPALSGAYLYDTGQVTRFAQRLFQVAVTVTTTWGLATRASHTDLARNLARRARVDDESLFALVFNGNAGIGYELALYFSALIALAIILLSAWATAEAIYLLALHVFRPDLLFSSRRALKFYEHVVALLDGRRGRLVLARRDAKQRLRAQRALARGAGPVVASAAAGLSGLDDDDDDGDGGDGGDGGSGGGDKYGGSTLPPRPPPQRGYRAPSEMAMLLTPVVWAWGRARARFDAWRQARWPGTKSEKTNALETPLLLLVEMDPTGEGHHVVDFPTEGDKTMGDDPDKPTSSGTATATATAAAAAATTADPLGDEDRARMRADARDQAAWEQSTRHRWAIVRGITWCYRSLRGWARNLLFDILAALGSGLGASRGRVSASFGQGVVLAGAIGAPGLKRPAFFYPTRLLAAFFVSTMLALVLACAMWVLFGRLSRYVHYLLATVLSDHVDENVVRIVDSVTLLAGGSGAVLAVLVHVCAWCMTMVSFRRDVLALRAGVYGNYRRRQFRISDASGFFGVQIAHSLLALAITYSVIFCITLICVVLAVFKSARETVSAFIGDWVTRAFLVFTLPSMIVQWLVRVLFAQPNGYLRWRSAYAIIDAVAMLQQLVAGFFLAVVRLGIALMYLLIYFARLDKTHFAPEIAHFDAGHATVRDFFFYFFYFIIYLFININNFFFSSHKKIDSTFPWCSRRTGTRTPWRVPLSTCSSRPSAAGWNPGAPLGLGRRFPTSRARARTGCRPPSGGDVRRFRLPIRRKKTARRSTAEKMTPKRAPKSTRRPPERRRLRGCARRSAGRCS
jgi:hypothetical protein